MDRAQSSPGIVVGVKTSRLDALELETEKQTRMIEAVSSVVHALAAVVGAPPNPIAAAEPERSGTGLCRVTYELHDTRRFVIRTIAWMAAISSGLVVVLGILKGSGVIK